MAPSPPAPLLVPKTLSGLACGIFARADALNGVVRPAVVEEVAEVLYRLPEEEDRMLDAGERGLDRVVGGRLDELDAPGVIITDVRRLAADVEAAVPPVEGFE